MSWLVEAALKLRIAVLALSIMLIVVGIRLIPHLPLDVFPEFSPPYIEIQTEAPGLSAEEVENLVTFPLENALVGAPGLETIRSKSVLGLSSIRLLLNYDADVYRTRQLVQERLASETPRLPVVARAPVILQPLSSLSRMMKIGIWSEELDQREMTELAVWTIRPRLMAIPGVANVAIWGQRDKEFQVLVDPQRLRDHQVTLDMILKSAGDAVVLDAGGFVDTPNQRLAVRQLSPVETPEDLSQTVVAYRTGAVLRLGDVAKVQIGSPPAIGDAIINDVPGLLLIVEKQPAANILEVTRKIEAALDLMKPGLRGVEIDSTIFRPATFIERSIDNLTHALLIGCVLVVIILVLFLYDWRTAVISLTAIPLSLMATIVVLYWWGLTINTMIIAGLVIALGEVVDDAIIDVENIVRRLRLNRAEAQPRSPFRVVLAASLEVRSAVVYATAIIILVFLPIFFLEGLPGAFFRPLALGYVLAISASLLVALLVTPALSLMILPYGKKDAHEPPLSRWLRRPYHLILPWFIRRPMGAIALLIVSFLGTAWLTSQLGQEFLPSFQETDFLMHFVERPGTSIEAMDRVTIQASKELRSIPGVRNFGSHIGRAEAADEVVGPNFTELWISIDEQADYEKTHQQILETVEGYPGLYRDVLTYLRERVKEVLTGSSSSIVVRIYGPDLDVLREKAQEVAAAMENVEGAAHLKVEPQVLVPQVEVRLRPNAAERFGLTPGQVRRAVTTMLRGTKVGEVYENQKKYNVVVWGNEEARSDLTALHDLRIDTPTGGQVPLKDLADVSIVPAPNEVKREGGSRRIDVSCDAEGRDLGSVARDVEAAVLSVQFDRGYHPEFLGEYTARQQSQNQLLALSTVSLIGMILILYIDFQSLRLTLIVALTIPFALIGGVVAAWIAGGVLSLGSLIGFVTVLGIAARNGIMLVSHYRHLQLEEGEPFGLNLVVRGAEERLLPILMTVLTTSLALLPLAISGNKPGHEIEYPLAVVIVGGLVTSTILNLFILPPLYLLWGKPQPTVVED
ncbi:efflux RND transporter permease subunit [Blastopirellula sp. J2-11]|uniref:efflux RND transporter permease subunit n=1 Tax=Blastopirellula sp. J2-11 TaxID=2943192 RepID=UPI0021C7BC83|nr:efflux RND transporter permease subunit [Blastopirellula sp. J2-11]UUO04559.1 efflux RND transporter permease subunit [Blastopirellula sp. J2-11]